MRRLAELLFFVLLRWNSQRHRRGQIGDVWNNHDAVSQPAERKGTTLTPEEVVSTSLAESVRQCEAHCLLVL
jgi:hypothetical protein